MKKYMILCLVLIISFSAFAQRKALVIGNSSFDKNISSSSKNDAHLAKQALLALDYQVTSRNDLSYPQMVAVIDSFKTSLRTGDVAVFYYSGFAKQECGKNYLVPVSGKDGKKGNIQLVSVDVIREALTRATDSFIFLETKQEPTSFFKNPCSKDLGLAGIERLANNQAFAMSHGIGKNSKEKGEEFSKFTYHLFNKMTTEMLDFPDLMNSVVQEVKGTTGNSQVPYWKSGRTSPFSFYNPEQPLKYKFRLPAFQNMEGGGSYNF